MPETTAPLSNRHRIQLLTALALIVLLLACPGCQNQTAPQPASAEHQQPAADTAPTTDSMLWRHNINLHEWSQDTQSDEPAPGPDIPACTIPAPETTPPPSAPTAVKEERPEKTIISVPPDISFPLRDANDTYCEDITQNIPVFTDPCLADQMITVNFNQTDITSVIDTISDITGINFIIDEGISGTVTVLSPSQIRLGDLYDFFESILHVKGYAAIPAGDHVKITSIANAPRHNLQVRLGADPADMPQTNTLVNQMIPIRYADADAIANLLESRLPPGAAMSVYTPTNTLMITATSAAVHNLARIIQKLDIPSARRIITMIPLQFAAARELAQQITTIMSREQTRAIPTRNPAQPPRLHSSPQIQADARTNTLIVTASRQDTDTINQLVKRLDIQRPAGTDKYHVVYLQNAQAKEMAEALQPTLAGLAAAADDPTFIPVSINPETSTNSLIINASPQEFEVIHSLIRKLDIVREKILVELLIIEIGNEKLTEIGVDWATMDQAVSDGVRLFGNTDFGVIDGFMSGDSPGLNVGMFKEVAGEVKIGALLNALKKVTDVNILSTPSIMTLNHRTAKFIVGDNVPFVVKERITETEPSTPTVIREIDYKDIGVTLEITPHISQGGSIRLEISSVFDQLIESVTGFDAGTPTTAKRQIETEVAMAHGSTLVIGGLIRDDISKVQQKVPVLGEIPLLGELFKYERDRKQKTNLLLFITPYILSSPQESNAITRQKQQHIAPELEKRKNVHKDYPWQK